MFFLMQQGGMMMWVIFALFVAGLIVFLERAFHLHRARIKTDDFLKGICNILERNNIKEAVSICEETPGPVASITRAAILHHDKSRDVIEDAIERVGLTEIARIERRFGVLATIATVALLMGLLGTVIGVIQALLLFEGKFPLVHPGDIASGIWPALLTTAAGLIVAVVNYVCYNLLVGKMHYLVLDMEVAAAEITAFLTGHEGSVVHD